MKLPSSFIYLFIYLDEQDLTHHRVLKLFQENAKEKAKDHPKGTDQNRPEDESRPHPDSSQENPGDQKGRKHPDETLNKPVGKKDDESLSEPKIDVPLGSADVENEDIHYEPIEV